MDWRNKYMSKAILVIDKPNMCGECALRMAMICTPTMKDIDSVNTKMDWCPLQQMPEKSHTGKSDYYQWGDWEDGWNACIDGLLDE